MQDRNWWATEWDRTEYDRQRYEEAKQRLIVALGGKCMKCDTTENLQFDHVSRQLKQFAITSRWNRKKAELQQELAKCQLLCQPCHAEKTRTEVGVPHGGGKTGKRRCKCIPCRTRKREYMREWASKRKHRDDPTARESVSKTD